MSRPEPAGEQEVDFGRYWLAIIRRWWLPVGGVVIGVIVGFLVQTSGARPYKASTIVYLGQTFAPGTVSPIETLGTKLTWVDQLVKTRSTLREIGTKVGIKPTVLGGNTSFVTIRGVPTTKSAAAVLSPIIAVEVRDPSARKAVDAADLLANVLVKRFSEYARVKLATYKARLDRAEREMVKTDAKIATLQEQVNNATTAPGLSGAERYLLLSSLNSQLQFKQQRQFNLESSQFALNDAIALNQQIEQSRIVQPGTAARVAGASKRTGAVVGLVIGFLVGLLAALLWEPALVLAKRARTAD